MPTRGRSIDYQFRENAQVGDGKELDSWVMGLIPVRQTFTVG